MKIEITQPNMCDRPNVTGAALRSVVDAEERAKVQINAITATAVAFEAAFDLANKNPCATNLAIAIEAAVAFEDSVKTCDSSNFPRRVKVSVRSHAYWRPNRWHCSRSISESIDELCEELFIRLTDAGVPMDKSGTRTAKYWRDADARGC